MEDGTVHFTNAPTDPRYQRVTGFSSGTEAGWLRLPGAGARRVHRRRAGRHGVPRDPTLPRDTRLRDADPENLRRRVAGRRFERDLPDGRRRGDRHLHEHSAARPPLVSGARPAPGNAPASRSARTPRPPCVSRPGPGPRGPPASRPSPSAYGSARPQPTWVARGRRVI